MTKRFTIRTISLLGFFDTLLLTAAKSDKEDDTFYGIHVETSRGPFGEEPGDVDLIVGVSANGTVFGNTWIPGAGEIESGFWSIDNIKNIKYVFGPLAKRHESADKDSEEGHVVEIITGAEEGIVTIIEYNQDEPTTVSFPVLKDVFPYKGISRIINGDVSGNTPKDADGNEAVSGSLTVWTPELSLLAAVAAKRKGLLKLYRLNHPAGIHLAQIGDSWRGAIKPYIPLPEEGDAYKPDSDIFI